MNNPSATTKMFLLANGDSRHPLPLDVAEIILSVNGLNLSAMLHMFASVDMC